MQKIVNGFIIEADKKGYFYHRTRSWIQYDNPAQAYVWPEEEVKKILEAANNNPREWKIKPALLHPSTYYAPVDGKVEITSLGINAKEFGTPSFYKGGIIEERSRSFTVSSNIVGVMVHL